MKVLVVLCAVVAGCLAKPNVGYGYSAFSPLYPGYVSSYSYAHAAPVVATSYAATPYVAGPYVSAPVIAPIVPVAAPAVKTQYHSQDEHGNARYGHSEPHQAHDAAQDAHGNKAGTYSYVDPHGGFHRRDYVADSFGFRVQANDLPLAPAGGVPHDTPEVVAAKIEHAHAYAKELHGRVRRQAYSYVPDTPEVAAAKAAHLAEHARQSGHGHATPYTGYAAPYTHNYAGQYYGSSGSPAVNPDGTLQETPEVAAAKAAHLAEHAKASGHGHYAPAPYSGQYTSHSGQYASHSGHDDGDSNTGQYDSKYEGSSGHNAGQYNAYSSGQYSQSSGHYAGPQATPVVTASGFLAETPEVAAAKAAHYAEHAKASGHGHYAAAPTPYSGSYAPAHNEQYSHAVGNWGVPYLLANGHIADTKEVAEAKAAHLAMHRGKREVFYQTPAGTSPLFSAHPVPVVPYSAPVVAYSAPAVAVHSAPLGVPAIRTDIVHNPGHAQSYNVVAIH